jgi:hypothetical protein
MPKNKIIYCGILVVAATALMWLGAEVAKRIEWIFPYTAIAGAALIVAGIIVESRANAARKADGPVAEAEA